MIVCPKYMPIEHSQNTMIGVDFVSWFCKPRGRLERLSANSFHQPSPANTSVVLGRVPTVWQQSSLPIVREARRNYGTVVVEALNDRGSNLQLVRIH